MTNSTEEWTNEKFPYLNGERAGEGYRAVVWFAHTSAMQYASQAQLEEKAWDIAYALLKHNDRDAFISFMLDCGYKGERFVNWRNKGLVLQHILRQCGEIPDRLTAE